jgi:hypothetical protein
MFSGKRPPSPRIRKTGKFSFWVRIPKTHYSGGVTGSGWAKLTGHFTSAKSAIGGLSGAMHYSNGETCSAKTRFTVAS